MTKRMCLIYLRIFFSVMVITAIASFSSYSYQYYMLHSTAGFCSKFLIFFTSSMLAYMAFLILRMNKKQGREIKSL